MIHITGHNFKPREIIQNVFSPLVAVISSPQADEICHKNNLSFVEMIQPFSKLASEAHFRDISGASVSIKGLRLNICDIEWRPPQTVLARKLLNEAVTKGHIDPIKVTIGSNELEIPPSMPWFENWRETFLNVQFPSDHEFTRHFLSCLIILNSSDPNLLETAQQLTKKVQMLQNITPQKLPKWFTNDVLNCYVLLHDGSQSDITKVQQSFELLKSTFGDNLCFLIQINSMSDSSTENIDQWQRYIKRHPKYDIHSDHGSTPKTPQDLSSVTSMPSTVQMINYETTEQDSFLHPLSPTQEHAIEAIHSKYSTSSESLSSQHINPNVWPIESDVDLPHGMWLNSADIENLRHFIQDYTIRALIPYVEKLVSGLCDTITNKKGVSKSLLSATKRWFVTYKPGLNTTTQNAVIYSPESAELQTRKLGDLYFMFGHYNLAFQTYHQAKRDFNADSAWQYYAGALEMAALSAFMLGTASRKTYDYMEDSIICYLTVCKLPQFATRATLLSVECLKVAKMYGEAAKQLIRMTSEDSDLRSALLLEEAAYCFLSSYPPMYRKYGFHIVLSGNRYSRGGQRPHAYRCYKQAYQIYKNKQWSLAEDHIQYTIGKQAITLKKLDVAANCLGYLLRPTSQQNEIQQLIFLREYIGTQNEMLNKDKGLGILEITLPSVIQNSIRVLVSSHPPVATPHYFAATNISIKSSMADESKWHKLEEMIVQTASSKLIVFKPTRSLFTSATLNTDQPIGVHGEPIEISVILKNNIKPSITFTNINTLWEFRNDKNEVIKNIMSFQNNCNNDDKNKIASVLESNTIKEINLDKFEEKNITFKLMPKLIGNLKIIGIIGQIFAAKEPGGLIGCIYFEPQKYKTNDRLIKEQLEHYDNKLNIEILPPTSALQVSFSNIPADILAGEILPIKILLKNTGAESIKEIFIGCDSPRNFTLLDHNSDVPLSILRDFKDLTSENLSKDKEIRKQHVFKIQETKDGTALIGHASNVVQAWIQAPYQKGSFTIRLLIYYSVKDAHPKMKYRLVRNEFKFNVYESLRVEANCVISNYLTNDLGIDIDIRNLNEAHHPLTTEISVYSLHLTCSSYDLVQNKVIYLNQIELGEGQLGETCLKGTKSFNLRCGLRKNKKEITNDVLESLKNRLSSIYLTENISPSENYPKLESNYSFLIKNETKFLFSLGQSVSNEEFNNIVSQFDPHMTLIINWKALIVDQNSSQRLTYGQHFIQLRNLYEAVCCPPIPDNCIKTHLINDQTSHKIYEFQTKKNNKQENEDQSKSNNNFVVGKRCLLEDNFQAVNVSNIEYNNVF